MSYDNRVQSFTMPAGADLSAKQYYFAKNSSGTAVVCGDGQYAIGVIYNDPTSGNAATISDAGILKVVAGGTIAVNAQVASDGNGKAVTATTGEVILGTYLGTESCAAGDIIPVHFHPRGTAA